MANGLLDFLQGASNAAAANVSAPVDGLTWLLNKLGADIKTPVGGSDWMRERGLTAEPTNKLAGILGESVGGVLPMVTAAKAPQIAQGLLQAERNLAAPRTLNPQTGAILWHGSPHKFDAFDSSKIGTGEGAQAYGHGLYLADSPDVAKEYQRNLSAKGMSIDGKPIESTLENYNIQQMVGEYGQNLPILKTKLQEYAKQNATNPYADINSATNIVNAIERNAFDPKGGGALYKVDLPDEHIAKMLDWDKPLSKQSPEVQKAIPKVADYALLRKQYADIDSQISGLPPSSKLFNELSDKRRQLSSQMDYAKRLEKAVGSDIYEIIGGGRGNQLTASEKLREAGIPGIRYLDGGSRGTGAGTSNYVVFPGNEGLLSILERNGQPIK